MVLDGSKKTFLFVKHSFITPKFNQSKRSNFQGSSNSPTRKKHSAVRENRERRNSGWNGRKEEKSSVISINIGIHIWKQDFLPIVLPTINV